MLTWFKAKKVLGKDICQLPVSTENKEIHSQGSAAFWLNTKQRGHDSTECKLLFHISQLSGGVVHQNYVSSLDVPKINVTYEEESTEECLPFLTSNNSMVSMDRSKSVPTTLVGGGI